MQEDANRGVPRGKGRPVTNASAASAGDLGTTGRLLVMAGGVVVLAILAALFV